MKRLYNKSVHACGGREPGFTLLEMLTVVALLAVMAGVAITAYDSDADDTTATVLAQSEMAEIAKALRQFRRDVGGWPQVSHPADFSALYVFADTNNDGFEDDFDYPRFDRDTGRGWRGPYLERRGMACVDVNVEIAGQPLPASFIPYAKLDTFRHANPSPAFVWYAVSGSPVCNEPLPGRQGNPYLLLDMPTDATPQPPSPRIVSTGPDGIYNGTHATDACLPNGDDLVMCL